MNKNSILKGKLVILQLFYIIINKLKKLLQKSLNKEGKRNITNHNKSHCDEFKKEGRSLK